MILFADYEGLSSLFNHGIWLLLTTLAFLCGGFAMYFGASSTRAKTAAGLGFLACFLELGGMGIVWSHYVHDKGYVLRAAEYAHGPSGRLDKHWQEMAERNRPSSFFWALSLTALLLGVLALGLGVFREISERRRRPNIEGDIASRLREDGS